MKLVVNLFCRDTAAQLAFYQALLGLPEAEHSRSPIYRALDAGAFQLGFHAPAAYGLLALGDRVAPLPGAPVTAYPTFMLDSPLAVEAAVPRALALGARLVKAPYATYYHEWQTVLADPEDHVFRLSTAGLPDGVSAPPPPV